MSHFKNRVKKRLEKEKTRKFQEQRVQEKEKEADRLILLEMLQQDYDNTLKERDDAREVVKNIRQLGIPRRPTKEDSYEDLEKMIDIIPQIGDIVSNYIDNEIYNNPNRFLNKVEQFFTSEMTSYKFDKLKDIARQDLEKFAQIEGAIREYLEDKEKYETLFEYDKNKKDVQRGFENLVDNVLIDFGVNVSNMENNFKNNRNF